MHHYPCKVLDYDRNWVYIKVNYEDFSQIVIYHKLLQLNVEYVIKICYNTVQFMKELVTSFVFLQFSCH